MFLALTEDVSLIQDLAIVLAAAGIGGWICKRLHLSVVAGFLLAGILIGPNNSRFHLIEGIDRVHALAQVGLVFLMFWIGLGFSIRRMRRVGLRLIFTNLIAAFLLFYSFRSIGGILGWDEPGRVFLGAMFMIGSSAIISKLLTERNISHERDAQYSLGIVINEDAFVVIVLALLSSYVQFENFKLGAAGSVLIPLTLFIVLLLILGLVFIPKLLKFLQRNLDEELLTLFATALVFIFALVSVKAGFPMALGAFLLGAIVADTGAKNQIERFLKGNYHIMGTVFFTAIGMMIEVDLLAKHWILVLSLAVLTILFRAAAYAVGLLAVGARLQNAVRTGLLVTPVGEFSFIIASIGAGSGKVGNEFYAIAIGVSLLTALTAPILYKYSEGAGAWFGKHQTQPVFHFLSVYHDWLDRFRSLQKANFMWRLTSKRVLQIVREFLVISALLLFAEPIHYYLKRPDWLGPDLFFRNGTAILFWTILLAITTAPLLALWRNLGALIMIYSEALTPRNSGKRALRGVLEKTFKTVATLGIFLWLWLLLPLPDISGWEGLILLGGVFAWFWIFRRRLVFWHSKFEIALQDAVAPTQIEREEKLPYLLESHQDWKLNIIDCQLPDRTVHAGKSLAELQIRSRFGANIIGIQRQGFLIGNPAPTTLLFPSDRVLILGASSQIKEAQKFLTSRARDEVPRTDFDDIIMEQVHIPPGSPLHEKTVQELDLTRRFGIQIAGIRRKHEFLLSINASDRLLEEDQLLIIATPQQINRFQQFLSPQDL